MRTVLRRIAKLEEQFSPPDWKPRVSKEEQAAADLLRERYRRYKEASGQPFEDKPRIDLGGARIISEILGLRFRRPFAPNPAKPK